MVALGNRALAASCVPVKRPVGLSHNGVGNRALRVDPASVRWCLRASKTKRGRSAMTTPSKLRDKLRKIEALFVGAGTAGERLAAEAALERVRAKLLELERREPAAEMQFSVPDQWSRHLFVALCRRYGLKPYRYRRQRRTTVMVRAPRGFIEQVLWPEFRDLDGDLQAYLHEVTLKVIREEVYADTSEAAEVPEALPAA
jgi:hypothetical protein